MAERMNASNSELIMHTARLVEEAFDLDPELVKTLDFVTNVGHDGQIDEVFKRQPSGDDDKRGWLFLLGSSYLGYAIQEKLIRGDNDVSEEDFILALQSQLAEDGLRWGDTWKKRPVEGQLERTYERLRDYKDQYKNGGQEFPWLKVAGGIIINLYRLDNPDYQK
jgi:hypothetical protein